jgi:hypothetical protein
MTTSEQGSKKEPRQWVVAAATVTPSKRRRRKIALVALLLAVSLSVAIEIGIAASFSQGYALTTISYKHSLCITKVLDLSQKGVIRDAGGFDGAINECVQMTSANSIYGSVLSQHQG